VTDPAFSPGTQAERWNGNSWSIQQTAGPADATGSGLAAVSCPSTHVCIAVGSYTTATGQERPLLGRWTGTH
jgi:hypothetical protein